VVALNTCDPSCPDASGDRYVDCDNGTVTDNETGLVWLANANCFWQLDWFEAMAAVAGLADLPDDGDACASLTPDECDCGLSDGSSPGEWRLASIGEWEAMVADAGDCNPRITQDDGTTCWVDGCHGSGGATSWPSPQAPPPPPCSFYGVQTPSYWSSSSYVLGPANAWFVILTDGSVFPDGKVGNHYVWPVRGGQ